jgi:hypothetical protein
MKAVNYSELRQDIKPSSKREFFLLLANIRPLNLTLSKSTLPLICGEVKNECVSLKTRTMNVSMGMVVHLRSFLYWTLHREE